MVRSYIEATYPQLEFSEQIRCTFSAGIPTLEISRRTAKLQLLSLKSGGPQHSSTQNRCILSHNKPLDRDRSPSSSKKCVGVCRDTATQKRSLALIAFRASLTKSSNASCASFWKLAAIVTFGFAFVAFTTAPLSKNPPCYARRRRNLVKCGRRSSQSHHRRPSSFPRPWHRRLSQGQLDRGFHLPERDVPALSERDSG